MTTTDIIGVLRVDGERASVHLESSYDTDIADLWSAVTEPERLARWFAPVDGDLVLGGEFVINFDADDPSQRTEGAVLECRPPEHLAVRWRFKPAGDSTVRVDLSRDGASTRLVLDHERLPAGSSAGYGAGWQTYLEMLAADLRGEAGHGPQWDEREKELLPAYQAQLKA
ncbi:MAG: hypothetical protein QOI06_2122 [Nocardioidaceae bacterium]|jgi:uncharacterized protein YndB with AHSA1/START domain|nr:hypothetical protein [Nocardioidaceae bacterium]